MITSGRLALPTISGKGLFPVRAAERRCRGLREYATPSQTVVYRAQVGADGKFINMPAGPAIRVEPPPVFNPKFNYDASVK